MADTDWTGIVQQHGPIVWRTAYRLLNHEADAADCFQDCFVAAFETSKRTPIENWPGFLKAVATTSALQRLRQRCRNPRLEFTGAGTERTSTTSSADEIEAAELATGLREALAELDPRQAEVFCLVCLENASYADTASHLGVTVNHVGVLLNRAKAQLRKRLKSLAPTEE